MTFDTALIVTFGGLSAFLAIALVRSILREKEMSFNSRIKELETEFWAENDRMWQRINKCEEKCCPTQKADKNFYNTGA
jgi:predicted oxidoreductase (fatty acid repression mutant protein)